MRTQTSNPAHPDPRAPRATLLGQLGLLFASGASGLLLSPAAEGAPQSLLEAQGHALIGPGTTLPAPGSPPLTAPVFGSWTAVRADDGRAFMTLLEGGPTSGGLYSWSQAGGLVRLVGPGSPIPDGTGVPTTVNFSGAISPAVRVSASGQHILFGTRLSGMLTSESNDSALYVWSNGAPGLLAREGLGAPGTLGASIVSEFQQLFLDYTGLDETGAASFRVQLAGGDVVGTGNDELIYLGTPGNLTVVAREGAALPGGELLSELIPAQPTAVQRQVHRLGAQGTLLFDSRLLQGSSPVPLTVDNDQVVLLARPGQALTTLVREGDPAPFPGTSFGGAQGDWIRWIGSGPVLTAQNPGVQFLTSLNGAASAPGSIEALVEARTSGSAALARIGDPVVNLPGTGLAEFESPLFAFGPTGRAAFLGKLSGSAGSGDDSALLSVAPGGSIQAIAREGDVAPGTAGKLFDTGFTVFCVDPMDRIWFRARLQGSDSASSTLWVHEPGLGLRPAALAGDTIPTPSGQTITGTGYSLNPQWTTNGRPGAITVDSQVQVYMVGGASPSSAVTKLAIVELGTRTLSTSVPTVSVASGGTLDVPMQTGAELAGQLYLILGSSSGTAPGLPTDAGILPLNPDPLSFTMLNQANQGAFQSNFGPLSDAGTATANVQIPPGLVGLTGLTLTFAGLAIEVQGIPSVTLVTNAAPVQVVP